MLLLVLNNSAFGVPNPCDCDPADPGYSICQASCGSESGSGAGGAPDPCPCDPGAPDYIQCLMDNPSCEETSVPVNKNIIFLVISMVGFGIYTLYNSRDRDTIKF